MAEIHESLQFALDRRGPVARLREASNEEVQRLRDILPVPLADFVEIKGYCSFHDGLFTMCNPDELRPIAAQVFAVDPQFNHADCHVVGFSAFGELVCWSDRYRRFTISLPDSSIYSIALTREDFAPKISLERSAARIVPDRVDADFVDFAGEPMYERCQAMHGRLEPGECYGFFPALAAVGVGSPFRRVENIQRVKAMEHFAILAQMGDFHLMKTVPGGVAPVRRIG